MLAIDAAKRWRLSGGVKTASSERYEGIIVIQEQRVLATLLGIQRAQRHFGDGCTMSIADEVFDRAFFQ